MLDEIKKLTEKQALSFVQSIIKNNKMNLEAYLEGSTLYVEYTPENKDLADSIAYLFSGRNPNNKQNIVDNGRGTLYLVNKGVLFLADVKVITKSKDIVFNEDSLKDMLIDVYNGESEINSQEITNQFSADSIDSWYLILKMLKESNHIYMKHLTDRLVMPLAEELMKIDTSPNKELNKLIVISLIETYIEEKAEYTYLYEEIKPLYQKIKLYENTVKMSWDTLDYLITKNVDYIKEIQAIRLLYRLDVAMSEDVLKHYLRNLTRLGDEEIEKEHVGNEISQEWNDYLKKLGLRDVVIKDVLGSVESMDLGLEEPKETLSDFYIYLQNRLINEKKYAYNENGVLGLRLNSKIDTYLNKKYFDKETPFRLTNILNAYQIMDKEYVYTYRDFMNFEVSNYIKEFKGTDDSVEKKDNEDVNPNTRAYLSDLNLKENVINATVSYMLDLNLDDENPEQSISKLFKKIQEDIKATKQEVYSTHNYRELGLEAKIEQYINYHYLHGETPFRIVNILQAYALMDRNYHNYIYRWLDNMVSEYVDNLSEQEKTNKPKVKKESNLLKQLDNKDLKFVEDRVGITQILRIAATEENVVLELVDAYEEKVLDSYNGCLSKMIHDNPKQVVKEYKKLFKK